MREGKIELERRAMSETNIVRPSTRAPFEVLLPYFLEGAPKQRARGIFMRGTKDVGSEVQELVALTLKGTRRQVSIGLVRRHDADELLLKPRESVRAPAKELAAISKRPRKACEPSFSGDLDFALTEEYEDALRTMESADLVARTTEMTIPWPER